MGFPFSAVIVAPLWCVCGMLLIGIANSYFPEGETAFSLERNSHVTYSYDRIGEVQRQCASVLSASSELRSEYGGVTGMRGELSFVNGDWRQDDGGKFPIMPFDAGKSRGNFSGDWSPVNLASFWVTDVDHANRLKKSVPINGFMVMGITRDGTFVGNAYGGNPEFLLWPSHSQLSISFQGVYTESKRNGGERVLCLLGNTMLPTREADPANPWGWLKNPGEIPLSEDDQILLVLRYPMTFTLTNRIISGELRSLNRESNPKYFDVVRISSQLGKSAKYRFGSQNILSKACNPYPYKDNMTSDGLSVYKGASFCEILEEITREQTLYVVPNWRCNGTDDFCSKLGPFLSDKGIKLTDGGFQDVKLYMQDVICEQLTGKSNAGSARVSTVFRAVSPLENQYTASKRSGPNNMSLAAEGIWKSSNGQLCMVACLGFIDAKASSCNTRICMYIPTTFSIKQRSIILGTMSPIGNSSAFFPLSFERHVVPTELWNYFKLTHPKYSYSKIDSAGTVLERNEAFSFRTAVKKSLLTFPKLEDNEEFQNSLSLLSEDLTFHVPGFPDPMPNVQAPRVDIQMEILSVGPLFGRYWYTRNGSMWEQETPYRVKDEYTEKQLLMNVSAQLSLTGKGYGNFSVLFLEGLYDPRVGKMYLIGCRDVRASWKVLHQSYDLESGMDCLIDVVVAYPPITAQWLVNPTAKISIESQRTDDDDLHFDSVKLQTFPIIYRKQREGVLSRRGVEGILRILTLSLAVGSILSQLFYVKHNVDSLPYMSLVVLGVQALGYSIPLITGAEALFKRMASEPYDSSSGELESREWFNVIDYTVKLLLIVLLLLTLRLCQKVWKSRIRLQARASHEPSLGVPSDKRVLICTIVFHLIGYVIVLIIHGAKASQKPLRANAFLVDGENSHSLPVWVTELEEYAGLVEDFFLFPQIIGNLIWQIGCEPLGKLYYIGITLVRILPHVYDYIRAPAPNPYLSDDSEFVNPSLDFYSSFGDIAIPATAVILAIVVYIQQRWGYEKLSQILAIGRHKLLPSFRYERLPSKSSETELVPGVNGAAANEKEQAEVE